MNLSNSGLIYWIWLSQINGIGPVTAKNLLDTFKTPENIYKAAIDELVNISGIGSATSNIIYNSKSLAEAEDIINKCEKKSISVLTWSDYLYPSDIKNIKKAPIVLYFRGELIEDSMGVAIIGSRRCSDYGKRLTVEVCEFLAQNHVPIISGMAKGIC